MSKTRVSSVHQHKRGYMDGGMQYLVFFDGLPIQVLTMIHIAQLQSMTH
jgi:hypothetical protein